MSKFVRVQTELRDLALVKRALDELEIRYREDAVYTHRWTGRSERVAFLIDAPTPAFGLRAGEDGVLELVGDDMGMRALQKTLGRVQQRYAYHTVLAAVNEAGFDLVDERTAEDQVIRLTVRRWS
jgi:hypothetical protein